MSDDERDRILRLEIQTNQNRALLIQVANDVKSIKTKMNMAHGFAAGIAATVSAVWILIMAVVTYFKGGSST